MFIIKIYIYRVSFLLFLIAFFSLSIVFIFEKDHSNAIENSYEDTTLEHIEPILLQISITDDLTYDSFLLNSNELNARILGFNESKKIAIIEVTSSDKKEDVLIKTKRKFINSSIVIIPRFPSQSFHSVRNIYNIKAHMLN